MTKNERLIETDLSSMRINSLRMLTILSSFMLIEIFQSLFCMNSLFESIQVITRSTRK